MLRPLLLIYFPIGSLAKKATSLSIPIASLKFPAINNISHSTTRTKDWDDILTAHTDESVARTWTMKDKRVGKHVFNVSAEKKKSATVGSVKVWTLTQNKVLYTHDESFYRLSV